MCSLTFDLLVWYNWDKNVHLSPVFPKKMRKYANNSEILMLAQQFYLTLHLKFMRKYAKKSDIWTG